VDPASLESDIFGTLVLDCQIAVISEEFVEDEVRTKLYKMFILMVCSWKSQAVFLLHKNMTICAYCIDPLVPDVLRMWCAVWYWKPCVSYNYICSYAASI